MLEKMNKKIENKNIELKVTNKNLSLTNTDKEEDK